MDDISEIDLTSYSPSDETKTILKKHPFLLIVGPTASGKNTLTDHLVRTGKYHRIVTHTTRAPRYNHGILEKDGEDYHFINLAKAKQMLEKRQFIEAAYFVGNLYGTTIDEFIKANDQSKVPVGDIEVQGVNSIMNLSDKGIAIFLLPPSFEVLLQRLAGRYGHSHHDKDIKVRLMTAIAEINDLLSKDYYYAVVNDDINKTLKVVKEIVEENKSDQLQVKQALTKADKLKTDIEKYLASNI